MLVDVQGLPTLATFPLWVVFLIALWCVAREQRYSEGSDF